MISSSADLCLRSAKPGLPVRNFPSRNSQLAGRRSIWKACIGESTNRRADILRLELPARRCLTDFLRRAANTSHLAVTPAQSGQRQVGQPVALRWLRSSPPINMYSPAVRGWENSFRKRLAHAFAPPGRTYFSLALPPGMSASPTTKLPVWADHRDRFIYGIPGNQGRGFKVADDTRGPEFDPTSGEPNRQCRRA